MSFIAKNPLSLPEINNTPSTPDGTRGLFAKEDGFYEVDSNKKVVKLATTEDIKNSGGGIENIDDFLTKEDAANSYKYYGNVGIVPSDQSLFNFEINTTEKTAKIVGTYQEFNGYIPANLSGDIVIPYEYEITDGDNIGVYKVTEIGEYSLHYSDITSIRIPNTITKIGDYALQRCQKLNSITFPSSVYLLGEGVCAYSGLSSVIFEGNGVSRIPKYAFIDCRIGSVTLPKYTSTIGEYAFYENLGMYEITIPVSLQTVGYNAFEYCWDVRDIWYHGSKEEWNSIIFDNGNDIFKNTPLHYKSVSATEGYVDEKIDKISVEGSAPTQSFVNILGGSENWEAENIYDNSGNIIGSRYGQAVNVNNAVITPNSKVDLQITSEQMVVFYEKSLAFVAENDDGAVTVYCVGGIPQNDYTVQAIVTEVVVDG